MEETVCLGRTLTKVRRKPGRHAAADYDEYHEAIQKLTRAMCPSVVIDRTMPAK